MTCSQCRQWIQMPVDPNNIAAERGGECRAVPPQVIVLYTPAGPQSGVAYPPTPPHFPACGLFVPLQQLAATQQVNGTR